MRQLRADMGTIVAAWVLLFGTSGSFGVPVMNGVGTLTASSAWQINLSHTVAMAPALLAMSLTRADFAFQGTTIVPALDFALGLTTSSSGGQTLAGVWPSGIPSGFGLYLQAGIQDNAAATGIAITNALELRTP